MITQKIIARTDSLKLDKIISRYGEDSMRQVVFIIVRPDPESEELIPITIPEDAVGSFRILKPSGNFVIVPMSKSVLATGETAFDVVIPASANTAKGSGYYDIRITSDTDKYYFTAQGDFLIDDNIISDEVLEDVSEVNGLVFPDDFLTREDAGAVIDDTTTSTESTWSSNKINEELESHAIEVTQDILYNASSMSEREINVDLTAYDEYVFMANDIIAATQIPAGNILPKAVIEYIINNNSSLVIYGYGSSACIYTLSSNKLTYMSGSGGYKITMIVGIKINN